MPYTCEKDSSGNWRLKDESGNIATNAQGTPMDGGGHASEEKCNDQAGAIMANEKQ